MKSLSHCRKVLLVSQSSFLDTAMKWILTCSTLKAQAWFWYEPSRVKELHSFTKPLKTTTNILKKKKRDTLKCLLILLVFISPAVNTQKSSEGVFIVLQQVKGQCCSHLKNKCVQMYSTKCLVKKTVGQQLLRIIGADHTVFSGPCWWSHLSIQTLQTWDDKLLQINCTQSGRFILQHTKHTHTEILCGMNL